MVSQAGGRQTGWVLYAFERPSVVHLSRIAAQVIGSHAPNIAHWQS
jgi:hypothetical protein